ncbi:MAG: SGNH/GDSL hydrolase family protein [Clostridia bacterium]|nr:SGNH/GDSL hydrolase family protein [Clostridia bacterium]
MKYDNKISTVPVWEGKTVYNETVWPVDLDGGEIVIPLLYHADKIISVTNTALDTVYEQGKDYELCDGKILIKRGGNMRITPRGEFFLSEIQKDSPFQIGAEGGGWLYFAEGDGITKKQYCVTYGHKDEWNMKKPAPTKKLKKTREKINNKEPFTFAFFGDSITYGCNSSGMKDIMVPPFAPIWSIMTVEYLNNNGGRVKHINRAVGGMTSAWGAEQIYPLFKDDKPDLMLIAFGMNDATVERFEEYTEKMIEDALKINPDCEFLLVSTTLPHKLAAGFYREQYKQQAILEKICEKHGDSTELVPMTDMHSALLSKKRFYDMTGNNVNHPNDFLAAVHAQTILKILGVL